ncbi:terminase gpA endonuclease subunit [Bosea sp. (in: a-proteobacteria)]|uniref:terminase gpA endonuclease subunit n=1 Tax=Bosea sp. (in: a-proteobacteria) TaxID=1871050 RepID=UPI00273440F3|nr:terminase gpA endonuclease subunit [Bosea sp. (in: a-proteobacteria)]MDP3408082.1 phage terminase large subunit family protein [Bosea sp. (in: a-proteobacteria)]
MTPATADAPARAPLNVDISSLTRLGRRRFKRGVARLAAYLRANPFKRGVDWVHDVGFIPSGTRIGPARLDITQRAIFDAMQRFGVKTVVWLKPPRSGSSTLTAWMMLFKALYDGQNVIFYERSDQEGQRFHNKKLLPFWEASDKIVHLLRGDTKTGVQDSWSDMYPANGSSIQIRGAHADGNFKAISGEWIFIDEAGDKVYSATTVDSEGNKIGQARSRYAEFPDGKLYLGGTPTTTNCAVVVEHEACDDKLHLVMPFPCCDGAPQPFLPRVSQKGAKTEIPGPGLKFTCDDGGEVDEIGYECAHCRTWLVEKLRNDTMEAGEYVSKVPVKGPVTSVGIETWVIHSKDPSYIWSEIIKMYRAQLVNPTLQQVWQNLWLARAYEPISIGRRDPHELAARAEDYGAGCPFEVIRTFAGIDFQRGSETKGKHPRVEIYTIGIGPNEEKWVLGRKVIDRVPTFYHDDDGVIEESWERIDPTGPEAMALIWAHLDEGYTRPDGTKIYATRVGVDTGYESTKVMALCSHPESRRRRLTPFKSRSERPSHFGKRAQVLATAPSRRGDRSGLKVTPIGSMALKDYIFQCLDIDPGQPFSWHFPLTLAGDGDDFFEQLTAEELVEDLKNAELTSWQIPRSRAGASNEALDCIVYALAAMHYEKAVNMRVKKDLALDPEAARKKPRHKPGKDSNVALKEPRGEAQAETGTAETAPRSGRQRMAAALAALPPDIAKVLAPIAQATLRQPAKPTAAPVTVQPRQPAGPRLSASEYARQMRAGQIKPQPVLPQGRTEERSEGRRPRPRRPNRLLNW